jgi:aldose 1-epimerase
MYERDAEHMPSGRIVEPRPGPWDDCFVNTAPVGLRFPGFDVTVTSDCDHWVVFDEPRDATCVEPQSGPPDAFNLAEPGPAVLEPGGEHVRTMTIEWRRDA